MQTHQTPLSDRLAIPLTDARHPRHHRLARPLVYYSRSIAMASGTIAPWVDLWVRLWLAQTFLVSGLLKIGNAATVIRAGVEGGAPPKPFRYIHLGSLATIGRKAAVADFGFLRLSGALAWWLWGLVHVSFLEGTRNRISVMLDWAWAYVTFRSSTRLITAEVPSSSDPRSRHDD